jgi:alkylhydroperoxidase family enzyme
MLLWGLTTCYYEVRRLRRPSKLVTRQYLHFCTSKASKVSTVFAEAGLRAVAAAAACSFCVSICTFVIVKQVN